MSLWVDKHRPRELAKLDYHLAQAQSLSRLVAQGDFPHLLFTGPSGAGKKTRILCLLRELYGTGVDRVRRETFSFLTPSKKKMEVATVASNYHIQVNPSDAGVYDRLVVMELIKTVAQSQQLDSHSQRDFKVILVEEADLLSRDAQHALRRTMEKHVARCRLVLCARTGSGLTPAVRSRCLQVRVPAPSKEEIVTALFKCCKKEGLSLPRRLAERIADSCGGNLRRALLTCEACKVQKYPFTEDQPVPEPDWRIRIAETAKMILAEQSPNSLAAVRTRLYELLARGIPPDVIFEGLYRRLAADCDIQMKSEIASYAARYEHRMIRGGKRIFHLEAFVARFMSVHKKFIEESMKDF